MPGNPLERINVFMVNYIHHLGRRVIPVILRNVISIAIAIGMLCLLASGCSGAQGDSVLPKPDDESIIQSPELPQKEGQSGRQLWGVWQFTYDESSNELTPIPLREAYAHFNVTPMLLPPDCNDCLSTVVTDVDLFTATVDADVNLRNPSQLVGHDVRGIVFETDLGCELLNPDDWTGLYDIPEGGWLNPFRTFAKDVPFRAFDEGAIHTEHYQVRFASLPGHVIFAVDASWPGNCREPYEISGFLQSSLSDTVGSDAKIYVNVFDWQYDVTKVTLVAPKITGEQFTQLYHQSGVTWALDLTNNTGALAGEYTARIIAASTNGAGIALYDFVTIIVSQSGVPSNPVEVTRPWLDFTPQDVVVEGKYAYAACGDFGLHIVDISDPLKPAWVNWVDLPGTAEYLDVANGYAYVVGDGMMLQVVDVDPPQWAHIAAEVNELGIDLALSVEIEGDALLVAAGVSFLTFDITQPEIPVLVADFPTTHGPRDYEPSGGMGYAVDYWGMIFAVIDPVQQTYPLSVVKFSNDIIEIDVENGLMFAGLKTPWLYVYDISIPGQVNYVNRINYDGERPKDLIVLNGYAYLSTMDALLIFDIDPVGSMKLIRSVELTHPSLNAAYNVDISGGYAYIAEGKAIDIIDIDPPESAAEITEINFCRAAGSVEVDGNYIYASGPYSFDIYRIEDPEIPELVKSVEVYAPGEIVISGGYAYISGYENFRIIDIAPWESAHVINSIDMPKASGGAIDYASGYAYVLNGYEGLKIIDVDPPESASVVHTVASPLQPEDAMVQGKIAYMVDYAYGLQLIDITTPESASIIKSVDSTSGGYTVGVTGDYAYVGCNASYIYIIDVNPPESAYCVGSLNVNMKSNIEMNIYGNYLYTSATKGVAISDITDPATPYFVSSLNLRRGFSVDLAVKDNYAYVATADCGLRVLKLW